MELCVWVFFVYKSETNICAIKSLQYEQEHFKIIKHGMWVQILAATEFNVELYLVVHKV